MSSKTFDLGSLGSVTVYKRRGTRRINLRVSGNKIKITQPVWLPYASGVTFAKNNKTWISEQQSKQKSASLKNGMGVGKHHELRFEHALTARSRIKDGYITIYTPRANWTDLDTQEIAKKAIKRALKNEAIEILPSRLNAISDQYGFTCKDIKFKAMRTRWGSCNSSKIVTLNIYLMMLPWELIDYVLLHELAHTVHLHHGKDFWQTVDKIMPDYKKRKTQLKTMQHLIMPIQ
jgi:hypothetical protein